MSQKHSLNSVALAAVFALAIFLVALGLLLFVGEFGVMGSIFMALMVSLVAGIFLFIGFGTPVTQSAPATMRAAAPAPSEAPPAAAPVAEPSEPEVDPEIEAARRKAEEEAAAIAARRQADEEAAAARQRAEAEEAAEAARRQAEEEAAAEAERVRAEEEAARRRAEEEAAAKAARVREEQAAAEAAAPAEPAEDVSTTPDYDGDGVHEGTNEGTRPAGRDAPRDGKADDLKLIKGIGPKLEKLCNRLGFWHFDQVAAWTDDEVAWVDANLEGFNGRVTRDEWVSQAKVLAAGGETEFSKRVEDGDVY